MEVYDADVALDEACAENVPVCVPLSQNRHRFNADPHLRLIFSIFGGITTCQWYSTNRYTHHQLTNSLDLGSVISRPSSPSIRHTAHS